MRLTPSQAAWRVPRSWRTEPGQRSAAAAVEHSNASTQRLLKAAVVFALLALTVLDRFGLRVTDTYSVNPAIFALYGLVAVMLLTRSARINGVCASAYLATAVVAGLSFLINLALDPQPYASLGSLLLLAVLYAPLIVSIRPSVGTTDLWQWTMNAYILFAVGLAVAGIVQFYAQFVFRAPWLFDYTSLIPDAIRGSGTYNTINEAGSLIKSNGFFLREASGFSWYTALALVCEWGMKRRKHVLGVLGLAIVVSYSGSGLLALGVALLFPLGLRTLLRVVGCVAVVAVLVLLLGDALNLTYTINRVGEFDSTHSSAYCRFILPGKVVAEQIDSAAWTTLVGHGPGTTQKLFGTCETTYAKLVIEYGLLGTLALVVLILAAIQRSVAPVRVRAVLVVQWLLLGGNLLAPESMLFIVLMSSMWPAGVGQGPASPPTPNPRIANRVSRRHESS